MQRKHLSTRGRAGDSLRLRNAQPGESVDAPAQTLCREASLAQAMGGRFQVAIARETLAAAREPNTPPDLDVLFARRAARYSTGRAPPARKMERHDALHDDGVGDRGTRSVDRSGGRPGAH